MPKKDNDLITTSLAALILSVHRAHVIKIMRVGNLKSKGRGGASGREHLFSRQQVIYYRDHRPPQHRPVGIKEKKKRDGWTPERRANTVKGLVGKGESRKIDPTK